MAGFQPYKRAQAVHPLMCSSSGRGSGERQTLSMSLRGLLTGVSPPELLCKHRESYGAVTHHLQVFSVAGKKQAKIVCRVLANSAQTCMLAAFSAGHLLDMQPSE